MAQLVDIDDQPDIKPGVQAVAAQPTDSRLARVRALAAQYPKPVWLMALANLVLWTGRGMITPFVVIFFSQIAGLSASMVGTGIAVSGLGGIVFVSLAAGQIDRRGGHPVLPLVDRLATLLRRHHRAQLCGPAVLASLGRHIRLAATSGGAGASLHATARGQRCRSWAGRADRRRDGGRRWDGAVQDALYS
jgi:hypothetical protein